MPMYVVSQGLGIMADSLACTIEPCLLIQGAARDL